MLLKFIDKYNGFRGKNNNFKNNKNNIILMKIMCKIVFIKFRNV